MILPAPSLDASSSFLCLPDATVGGGQSDEKPEPLFLQKFGVSVRFGDIWTVEQN